MSWKVTTWLLKPLSYAEDIKGWREKRWWRDWWGLPPPPGGKQEEFSRRPQGLSRSLQSGGHSQLAHDFCLGNATEDRDADGSVFCLRGARGVAAACAHPVAQGLFGESDTSFPVQQLMWLVLNQCQPPPSPLPLSVSRSQQTRSCRLVHGHGLYLS